MSARFKKPPGPDPIGLRMREERVARGWSLDEAERQLRIPAPVIGSHERGDRDPSLSRLRDWVGRFGFRIVLLEPGQTVVSDDPAGEEYVTWHVCVEGAEVDAGSRAEAETLQRSMFGSKVGYRHCHRGPIEFPGGES